MKMDVFTTTAQRQTGSYNYKFLFLQLEYDLLLVPLPAGEPVSDLLPHNHL